MANKKKTISVVIPTFNEEENVIPIYEAITNEMKKNLSKYNYDIIFIDNYSKDTTRKKIEGLCARDRRVKAIFNCKNFGPFKSPFYGILQAKGDCVVFAAADFQDPIEMIPKFVAEWEKGYRIVIGVKTSSKENKLMYFIRTLYYKFLKKFSDVEQIEHFTGFGLYDQSFIGVLRSIDDRMPFLRSLVSELGYERKEIPFVQAKRRAGKTSTTWYSLYEAAMLGITSYTKVGLRSATFVGFITAILSFLVGIAYLVYKLIFWSVFPLGLAPLVIGIFFLGAVQLLFIGLMGEYILNINTRVMKHPLVIEEKRINF